MMKADRLSFQLIGPALILAIVIAVAAMLLAGCTMTPDGGKAATDYPDATTPKGMNEFNGGLLDDITINGRGYNVVTDGLAARVAKRVGGTSGFVSIWYVSHEQWRVQGVLNHLPGSTPLTAIDKGVMFTYVSSGGATAK
jgi:hypothetical protein